MIPNTGVLEHCQISGIEAFLMKAQFRWTGHVIRMEDDRIPKRTFYGQMTDGTHRTGGQLKRFQGQSQGKSQSVPNPTHGARIPGTGPDSLASLLQRCHRQIRRQQNTLSYQKDKRQRRKLCLMPGVKVASIPHGQFNCDVCSRIYVSRIGDEIRHIDDSLHHQDRLTYDIDRVSNSYVFL